MRRVNCFLNASDRGIMFFISASTEAYFFFPTVRLHTIVVSADPRAPAREATLPPPGAGEFVASSSRKAERFFWLSMRGLLCYSVRLIYRTRRQIMYST